MVMGFAFHASGKMEWKIQNSKNIPIPCKNIPKMEWNGKYHSVFFSSFFLSLLMSNLRLLLKVALVFLAKQRRYRVDGAAAAGHRKPVPK